MSEMAESESKNVEVINRRLHELQAAEVVNNLRKLADSMNAMNRRNQIAPQPDDTEISAFMRYVLDDEEDEKEAFFNKLEVLGNAMYLTATQFKTSNTILRNLDWYTNMLNACDGTDADLNVRPTLHK